MIPVKQKYLVISEKQAGDCWRACLASILECDIDLFPAPEWKDDWSDYYPKVLKVINDMGYQLIGYTIENLNDCPLDAPDTDGYVVAVGKSPRSTPDKRTNHAVVWKNGIVHDPHPSNAGINDIVTFEVLTKLNK